MVKTEKKEASEEDKIRARSVLISELRADEQEEFRRHMDETVPRSCPIPLPGDAPGDLRAWLADYVRWEKGLYGIA